MSESPEFEPVEVVPRGREFLACSFLRPRDWRDVPVPAQEPKLEDAASFLPLAICMASYDVIVFSVAARPAARATSGGEGAALSRERDQRIAALRGLLGLS